METLANVKTKVRKFYVPDNLDPVYFIPSEYHNKLDRFHYITHQIYVSNAINKRAFKEYCPLMADYLREVLPDYKDILRIMIDNQILDEPEPYIKGTKATGYRFHQAMQGHFSMIPATDLALVKRYEQAQQRAKSRIQWDVHKYLLRWQKKLKIEGNEARERLADLYDCDPTTYGSQLMLVDMIDQKQPFLTVDEYGRRVHTPLTSLSSKIRPYLRAEGQPLVGLDIACSQPYFLSLIIINACKNWDSKGHSLANLQTFNLPENPKSFPFPSPLPPYDAKSILDLDVNGEDVTSCDVSKNEARLDAISLPSDVKRLAKDILKGTFYEALQTLYNARSKRKPLDRASIKAKLFGALYCHPRDESLMTRILEDLYPTAMSIVSQFKEGDHKRVSRAMQRQESWTMLGVIVRELKDNYKHIPVYTIHDSILTTPEHVETVKAIMIRAFQTIGLVPKITITDYGMTN